MKLKHLLLIFLIIPTCTIGYAQEGYAYYQKQLVSPIAEDNSNNYLKQALHQLKKQEYELAFAKHNAQYKKKETLGIESNPIVTAYTESMSQFSGEVYFDRTTNTVIHKKEFSGSTFLVHKTNIHWTLTKDTLRINNYLCYKATTTRTIQNSEGEHELQITAWYTSEIPLPYGPDGYGGLPGLILQLENNGTLTFLKSIKHTTNKTLNINRPSKGKQLSEEDFNSLVAQAFMDRKRR